MMPTYVHTSSTLIIRLCSVNNASFKNTSIQPGRQSTQCCIPQYQVTMPIYKRNDSMPATSLPSKQLEQAAQLQQTLDDNGSVRACVSFCDTPSIFYVFPSTAYSRDGYKQLECPSRRSTSPETADSDDQFFYCTYPGDFIKESSAAHVSRARMMGL